MAKVPAEVSSISSALDDLLTRIGKIADQLDTDGHNEVAYELFEIERALTPGQRRLHRLITR